MGRFSVAPFGRLLRLKSEKELSSILQITPDIIYRLDTEGRITGIGAYSAGLMARTLGGDIRFESAEEKGTTITVQLPLA